MGRPADRLRAPFPWFGGKSLASDLIWAAFGDVPNYCEPFAGSCAVLLGRPNGPGKVETINDLDGFIANVWRAIKLAPDDVARWVDWPVNEADLHARHRWLVKQVPLLERLVDDPEWFDAKIAGWWLWGVCAWIGNGWCSADERLHRTLPKVGTPGHGVHAPGRRMPRNARGLAGIHATSRKKPLTHRNRGVHRDAKPPDMFERLADRLRHVRVCCGDWTRVLGRSTLGIDTSHGMTPCGVLLDPPYTHDLRDRRLYREDDASISAKVREWAIEHGDKPQLRIALCGFETEHDMPDSWTSVAWASTSSAKSRAQERIWFSPHCLSIAGQQVLAL